MTDVPFYVMWIIFFLVWVVLFIDFLRRKHTLDHSDGIEMVFYLFLFIFIF